MTRFRNKRPACCRWPQIAGSLLPAAIVGLLGVAFGGSAQEQPAAPQQARLPKDLERVPGDVGLIVSVRLVDLWNSQPFKMIRQQGTPELSEAIRKLEKEIGVAVEEVERATVVSNDLESLRSLVFITTLKPCDRARILSTALVKAEQQVHTI
jgi:hypothetical protein